MAFVRTTWGAENAPRNGSILKALWQRYGPSEVEVMVRGAAQLGWKDLRGLYSKEGIGRRWAQTAYWNATKKAPTQLDAVGAILQAKGLVK